MGFVPLTMLCRYHVTLLMLATLMKDINSQECSSDCVPCPNNAGIINIGVLLNQDTAVKALPVIYLAQQHLKENGLRGPLQDYDVQIVYRDTKCSSTTGPLEAFELYSKGATDVFLGPVCDYALAPICRYSSHWGIPVLSPAGKPDPFNSDPGSVMLTRLNGHYAQLAEALRNMCDKWDWRIVGLLYEDNEEESLGRSDCHHQMSSVYQHFKDNNIIAKPKNFKDSSNLYEILDELSNISRVIMFCTISKDNVKRLMLAAHSRGLTSGEYVFFNVDLDAGPAENYRPWGDDEKTKPAFSAMFTVASHTPSTQDYKEFSEKVRALASDTNESELHALLRSMTNESYPDQLVTPYMASFYEGVTLYVEAFNRTIEKKRTSSKLIPRDVTKEIIDEIVNGTFYSNLKKKNITLLNNSIPDDYSVYNKDEQGDYMEVAVFLSQQPTMNVTGELHWPGGRKPKDSPHCGFEGEFCPPGSELKWIIAVLSLLVIVLVVFSIIAIRRLYRLRSLVGKMLRYTPPPEETVDLDMHVTTSTSTLLTCASSSVGSTLPCGSQQSRH